MNEFLGQNYYLITYSVEFLAAGTGLIFYKKFKSTTAIFFIWFLLYSFLIDLISLYPRVFYNLGIEGYIKNTLFSQNYWFATIFWVLGSTIFYVFYFQKIIQNPRLKHVLKITNRLFIILSILLLIIFFKNLYSGYIPTIHIISTLSVILAISLFLYDVLNSDVILIFYKSLNFYISVIALIWWLITTPLVFYEIYANTSDWNFVFLKWQIFLFANVFMYLGFTFALIFCKPQHD